MVKLFHRGYASKSKMREIKNMIEARNLKKVYAPKKGVKVHALDDVSLKLPDTGMVFILGKSGSGKSTLLNVLGGLDSFDSGEIIIKGQSSKDFKQSHFDSYRNTYVGFIFQEYNILEEFTVGANIALAIELQGRKASNQEINDILKQVDLDGLGARKPNELSGGQKQRVAIARALVKKPEIIMADEPTGALDSNTGRQVFDTLKELSKSKLVLIVSHDREFSELYADRIIELADGKIISDVEYDKEASEAGEEPNLTYSGKEITIKDGYELTEDDIVSINQYIKKIKSGATLIVNDERREKIFKKTDESKIVHKITNAFKLIKSRLSIKNAFKLGSSGLKHKKVRLVVTILLSFIAFSLFGLADSVASYDNITTCTDSLMDSNINYASFVKNTKYSYDDENYYWDTWDPKKISKDEVTILENETGLKYVPILGGYNLNLEYTTEVGSSTDSRYSWEQVFPRSFSGMVALNNELVSNFGYTLMSGSKLPTSNNEIVIPKYIADYYVKNGYIEFNKEDYTSTVVEINSATDMIGKEITVRVSYNLPDSSTRYKIVGIIDTGFDISRYEVLADTTNENGIYGMAVYSELQSVQKYSLNAAMFVSQDFFDEINKLTNSNQSNVRNGNFEIIRYKSKDLDLDSEENYISYPRGYSNLIKLTQADKYNIHWIGEKPDALGKYDIVLSINDVQDLMNNTIYSPDKNHLDLSEISATDIELEYANHFGWDDANLGNLQTHLAKIAAYKYAFDASNYDNVLHYLKQVMPDFNENNYTYWDEELEQDVVNKTWIREIFVERFSDPTNASKRPYDEKAYYEDMASRYNIADKIISYEQYSQRVLKLPDNAGYYEVFSSIDVESYKSYTRTIIASNYAIKSFENAYNAAKMSSTKPDWYQENSPYSSFMYYKDRYSNALHGGTTDISSEELAELRALYINAFIENYKNSFSENLAIRYVCYNKDELKGESKDARIVGVIIDSTYGVVVNDEIYNALVDEVSMGDYQFLVAPMPTSRSDVNSLVKFSYNNSHFDDRAKFALKNSVTEELSMIDETLEILGQVFLYIGLGFALFAALMLSNFIATSISYKKQEIGILRAIGSRSRDVFMIFFAESFIIAMINFVLSAVTTGVVVSFLNNIFRNDVGLLITFLSFGIRQIALILGASLLVALIATFLPVKKIASMKPIDAIKNRK